MFPVRLFKDPIPRADGVSPRAVRLALGGRFADELLFGAVEALLPAIRTLLGMSYAQISVLMLALDYVGAVVDPINGFLTDIVRRKWLIAWGAAGIGVAVMLIGLAPTFAMLLVAFAIYGAASGPLAHTADIVLVEMHPSAASRIFARATAFDTVGALLGPLLVAAVFWFGLPWQWLLVGLGVASLCYAAALLRANFPAPASHRETAGERESHWTLLHANVRAVLTDCPTLFWLAFLRAFYLVEAPSVFHAVWLADVGGMDQVTIGIYLAFETAVNLGGVLFLGRWLRFASTRRIVLVSVSSLIVLYPLWFLMDSTAARFVLAVPLSFMYAALWPIGRSESLSAAAGRPGALDAVNSLMGLLPVTLGIGLLAEAIGLTPALLGVHLVGAVLLLGISWRWLPQGIVTTREKEGTGA